MRIEFYKIHEAYAHKYYKVPKDLFENSRYKTILNSDAKLLYALLLDRMELSRENGWVNEQGEIYLIYTRDDLCDMLGLCRNTMTKAFQQLSDTGLISEKRQGRGLPNLIFIGKIRRDETDNPSQKKDYPQTYPQYPHNPQPQAGSLSLDSQNLGIKKRKKCESRIPKNELLDSQNFSTRETDINKTEKNETENSQSVSQADRTPDRPTGQTELHPPLQISNESAGTLPIGKADISSDVTKLEKIIDQCQLYLCQDRNVQNVFRHVLEIMWFSEYLKIGSARIPQCMVRSRMYLLNLSILEYALRKIKIKAENIKEIRNSTMYLVSAIFNSLTEYHLDPEVDPELNKTMDHPFFIDENENTD